MENRYYLEDILKVPEKEQNACLAAMAKYKDSWWESTDPKCIVRNQMKESVLLVPLLKLQESLSFVLGRAVDIDEVHFDNEALQAEVESYVG